MKKIFLFILLLLMISPVCVRADHMYNIDMNIYVEKNGSAHIVEVWDVQADSGTEWCKILSNMENLDVSDFKVMMDDQEMKSVEWKTNGSLKDKAGKYGINYTSGGLELCFGKADKERHNFTLSYNISDYVVNTKDGQVIYHVLFPDFKVDTFFADIVTYYAIPNDLEVWSFGQTGNSYVDNGRIVVSNYDGINNQYVSVLARFPLETFDTKKTIGKFEVFDDVYKDAENAGYEYKNIGKFGRKFIFLDLVFILLGIFVVILIIEFIVRHVTGKSILEHDKIKPIVNKVKNVFKKIFEKVKKLFLKLKDKLKKNK